MCGFHAHGDWGRCCWLGGCGGAGQESGEQGVGYRKERAIRPGDQQQELRGGACGDLLPPGLPQNKALHPWEGAAVRPGHPPRRAYRAVRQVGGGAGRGAAGVSGGPARQGPAAGRAHRVCPTGAGPTAGAGGARG